MTATPVPPPSHLPVLLDPVIARAREAGVRRVVDATLGHGGHAAALRALGGEVLAIDRDPEALAIARARLGDTGIQYLQADYASAPALAAAVDFAPDFVLLDLGVSSRQLDDETRGFTFRQGAPLDMRMGPDAPTAQEWLETAGEAELARAFHDWADERRSRRLAAEVVRRRERGRFATSDDLVGAIRAVLGPRSGPGDFARIFQAVRIAVNDELAGLERALPAFRDALVPGGTLAVISYHSGEDRLVKHAFREWSAGCTCPPGLPQCVCARTPLGEASPRRSIVPSDEELAANPRARSARLRFFRRATVA
jgi:16S rRNA (cytosine1402-N4)-methyltransferase